jgi:hypothetical protein
MTRAQEHDEGIDNGNKVTIQTQAEVNFPTPQSANISERAAIPV